MEYRPGDNPSYLKRSFSRARRENYADGSTWIRIPWTTRIRYIARNLPVSSKANPANVKPNVPSVLRAQTPCVVLMNILSVQGQGVPLVVAAQCARPRRRR